MSVPEQVCFQLAEKPFLVPGCIHGLRYPSLVFRLAVDVPSKREWLQGVNAQLQSRLHGVQPAVVDAADQLRECVISMLHWLQLLQLRAGQPVYDRGRIISVVEHKIVRVAVPSFARGGQGCIDAFEWLCGLFSRAAKELDFTEFFSRIPAIVNALGIAAPPGANVPRFIRAAYDARIPFVEIPGRIFLIGQGRRGRWLDSSFTDATPGLGARLARYKVDAAEMLAAAGMPVARHVLVASVEAALDAAARLGYPVVVKPADLDGGTAVAAGLTTADEVREAFAAARQHSSRILVEKHFEGRDYRLTVLHGDLLWAIERVPGGVTGDGVNSVRALVARINADPNRGTDPLSPLSPLTLDREAQALLQRMGLDEDSVPPAGQFVRLRRAANVGMGGTPVAIFDRVHPDNRVLAIRAAAALRLDLAGIDLLIPDISHSWRESGAIICEVNAQPQLGGVTSAHVYGQILRALLVGDGRIPIAIVLGSPGADRLGSEVRALLENAGLVLGVVDANGAAINGERITQGRVDIHTAARMLMLDQSVDAALIFINDPSILVRGLPFDSFDLLMLAGVDFPGVEAGRRGMLLRDITNALLPNCRGAGVIGADLSVPVVLPKNGAGTVAWMDGPIESVRLAEVITRVLLDAHIRHSNDS